MADRLENSGTLYTVSGVPVGSWEMGRGYRHRSLSKKDRAYCAAFVETISKNRKEERTLMAETKKVFTSQIYVGGTVKRTGGGWCLVDVGEFSSFIFCSPERESPLLERIKKYEVGDHILIRGFLKLSSSKNEDGTYTNRANVVVTEIRSEDPKHEAKRAQAAENFSGASDDDIPF